MIVATALIAASLLSIYFLVDTPSHEAGSFTSIGNGVTFSRAWELLNASVSDLPGGPWKILDVLGMASDLPAAPFPSFEQSLNGTMSTCGKLGGVSLWNSSSIPTFTGTFNSGAAPFWSFVLGNGTATYHYATVLLGNPVVYSSAASTSCIDSAGLSGSNYPSTDTMAQGSVAVARSGFRATGAEFSSKHSPIVEYYVLGVPQLIELDQGPGWGVDYFRCDLTGVSGIQNYTVYLTDSGGNSTIDNGWISCTVSDYKVDFSSTPVNVTPPGAAGNYTALPFQVEFPPNGTTPAFYDGWGLASWMLKIGLDSGSMEPLQVAPATCLHWVSTLSDCPAAANGWFVVLLSSDGGWLDSFPSSTAQMSWSIPNVLITSNDEIVIVQPVSTSATGAVVTASGTSGGPAVEGEGTL